MHRVIRSLGIFIFGLGWTVAASAQTPRRPITFEELISMHRVSDPPDFAGWAMDCLHSGHAGQGSESRW